LLVYYLVLRDQGLGSFGVFRSLQTREGQVVSAG
jgi:hypothetical protein